MTMRRYQPDSNAFSAPDPTARADQPGLPALVDLLPPSPEEADALRAYASALPSLTLGQRALCDLEMLAIGAYSPLDRFMGRGDLQSSLETMRLTDGSLFPLPVTLPTAAAEALHLDRDIALCDDYNRPLAILSIEDIYPWRRDELAFLACGTRDTAHPLVREMQQWGPLNLTGRLRVLQPPQHHDFRHLRHTPAQIRALLAALGRRSVVAFQTRNPLHRAHEELVKRAIAAVNGTLLLHPAVGLTQPHDIDHYTRVRAYEALVNNYFEPSRVVLSLLPLAMRMAGPREALLHAQIRRNYGATHFIVGRDHAGPGSDSAGKPFYPPYAAQELVQQHERELGISVMAFQEMVYLPEEDRYEEQDRVPASARTLRISGTQVRQDYLARGRALPAWFTRPEVAHILAEAYGARGACVWLTGLSAAGKSTTAEILAVRLLEHGRQVTVLDGDIARAHLSSGLGFSKADRDTHIRRLGYVASEIVRHGGIVICAAISPYASVRAEVRRMMDGRFIEVFVDTPLALCEQRDPKGLYAKARRGDITGFTGIDDPYEPPADPEIHLSTASVTAEENAQHIFDYLLAQGYVKPAENAPE